MAAAGRTYVDFVPPHSLLEEPDKVVLRVDLTAEGFRKEQLKVQIDNFGRLRISGERPLRADGKRWRRFSEDFQVPEGCDAGAIRARLEKGGVLLITMPRLSPANKQEPTSTVAADANAGSVDDAKDQLQKDGTGARQEAAAPSAEADGEGKEDAGDASMERRDQDEQHVTSNNAGGAASAGRPAYGFAKKGGRRMVLAIAALVLTLIGAGLYARYKLMDPSAEPAPAGNHIVSLSDI